MRIVHLSATDISGGAARSTYRLHRGLREVGEASSMLVRRKLSQDPAVHVAGSALHPLATYGDLLQYTAIDRNRSPVSNTHFSLGWPGLDLSTDPAVQDADVLHLHWVAGFLSAASIAALLALRKKIVWTLHDMRPFTGGCHFSAGCARFETDCTPCPQLASDTFHLPGAMLSDTADVLRDSGIRIVAPSEWLAECARRSRLFSGLQIETIPYGLETDCFSPVPRAEARRRIGVPEDAFILLAGADHGAERRKGFVELAGTLRHCVSDPAFRRLIDAGRALLLTFGRPGEAITQLPLPVRPLGYIDSDRTLAAIYSAADLFVLPSLEDNLPNTVLESMSCGTPFAGFSIGGTPDLAREGTGLLAAAVEPGQLGRIICDAAIRPEQLGAMRANCRRRAESDFPLRLQAERYARLYASVQPANPCPAEFLEALGPAMQRIVVPLMLEGLQRYGLHPGDPSGQGNRRLERGRRRFARHLAALLRKSAAGRITVPSLLRRLRALLPVLQGANPWLIRARTSRW